MSTLQVANLHFESTGNNRIEYTTPNTVSIYAGGALVFQANTTSGGVAKFSANVGDGSATTYTLTHNLNRADVFVAVREISTGYFVYPDIKYNNTNSVILEFSSAPTANQYYASILGA